MNKQLPDTPSFLAMLEDQFDEMTPGSLKPATLFRELQQWNSLQALVIVASLNWKYDVTISANELRNTNTIHDLFLMVTQKMEAE